MRELLQQALERYLLKEMPAGTVIGDPVWWSSRIAKAIDLELAKSEQEPVAWYNPDESGLSFKKLRGDWQPLYALGESND